MKYTFGTSQIAADRLESIANFFNPLAFKFIKKYANDRANIALDLGCGPGFTTNMLYEAVKSNKTYGMDNSGEFLQKASKRFTNCIFINHDVTKTPFPISPDIIYARFLLSHLDNVIPIINRWVKELNVGGMLFLDEVEDVKTDHVIFKKYLDINEGLVGSQGAKLFVGKILGDAVFDAYVSCNECFIIPVKNYEAATWFYPNTVSIWEKEVYVRNILSHDERKQVSERLFRIKELKEQKSEITWYMRRIVLKKNS